MTNNLSPEVVALTMNTAQAGLLAGQANVVPPAPNSSFATGAVWSVPLPSTEPILESVLSVPSTPTSVIPSLFFLCCSFVYFDLYAPCVMHPVVTVDFGSFFSRGPSRHSFLECSLVVFPWGFEDSSSPGHRSHLTGYFQISGRFHPLTLALGSLQSCITKC